MVISPVRRPLMAPRSLKRLNSRPSRLWVMVSSCAAEIPAIFPETIFSRLRSCSTLSRYWLISTGNRVSSSATRCVFIWFTMLSPMNMESTGIAFGNLSRRKLSRCASTSGIIFLIFSGSVILLLMSSKENCCATNVPILFASCVCFLGNNPCRVIKPSLTGL